MKKSVGMQAQILYTINFIIPSLSSPLSARLRWKKPSSEEGEFAANFPLMNGTSIKTIQQNSGYRHARGVRTHTNFTRIEKSVGCVKVKGE